MCSATFKRRIVPYHPNPAFRGGKPVTAINNTRFPPACHKDISVTGSSGADSNTLLSNIKDSAVTPASSINQEVGERLDAIILKAPEKDPGSRFADAGEMLGALFEYREASDQQQGDKSSSKGTPWIPDQQKTLSGMTGLFFDFHVSQASMHPSGFYQQGF